MQIIHYGTKPNKCNVEIDISRFEFGKLLREFNPHSGPDVMQYFDEFLIWLNGNKCCSWATCENDSKKILNYKLFFESEEDVTEFKLRCL